VPSLSSLVGHRVADSGYPPAKRSAMLLRRNDVPPRGCYASLIYAVYGASWIAVNGAKRTTGLPVTIVRTSQVQQLGAAELRLLRQREQHLRAAHQRHDVIDFKTFYTPDLYWAG
jgi:hypothetical protein